MSRIMKLLAVANDENASPHERALAEETAERMMAKHMIDRFEAEQAAKKAGTATQRKPIQEDWEFASNAYVTKDGSGAEFDGQIRALMDAVLRHCNIRINPNYTYAKKVVGEDFETTRYSTDHSRKIYKIVGFPEDIAYAERIWFNVFRTFVSHINPQWDLDQNIEYNAYNFASAGVSWKQQVLLAEAAGDSRIEWPWRYQGENRNDKFFSSWNAGITIDPGNEPWGRSIHKLKRACKKYCDTHGVQYPYSGGAKLRMSSRNSFAQSYRSTIESRLQEIRKKAQEGDDGADRDKFALAIRDTSERVDEEFYHLFPDYDPEVRRKKQEEEAWRLAVLWASLSPAEQKRILREQEEEEVRWYRQQSKARRNYRTVREDPSTRFDEAAWNRGRNAAQSVNLRNDAEVKKETRKEID